jgi:hypothetical protein
VVGVNFLVYSAVVAYPCLHLACISDCFPNRISVVAFAPIGSRITVHGSRVFLRLSDSRFSSSYYYILLSERSTALAGRCVCFSTSPRSANPELCSAYPIASQIAYQWFLLQSVHGKRFTVHVFFDPSMDDGPSGTLDVTYV